LVAFDPRDGFALFLQRRGAADDLVVLVVVCDDG